MAVSFIGGGKRSTRWKLTPWVVIGTDCKHLSRSSPWLGWSLWNIFVTKDHGYVPLVANTSRSFNHSWLITGCVTSGTGTAYSLPEHLSAHPVFSGVRVTRSLVLYVCFVDRCLSFCTVLPFCFLFFFDIRILIAPLVSSNSSYHIRWKLHVWRHISLQ